MRKTKTFISKLDRRFYFIKKEIERKGNQFFTSFTNLKEVKVIKHD